MKDGISHEKTVEKIKEDIRDRSTKDYSSNIISHEEYYSGLYLFYSFDLVNSTSFKSKHPELWPRIFKQFYDYILKEVQTVHPKVKAWKYVGDEVLLYKKITELKELFNCPPHTFKIIQTVSDRLYKAADETKGVLFVKATIWIAPVKWGGTLEHAQTNGKPFKNIVFPVNPEYPVDNNNSNVELIDFLGPDIDLGFRINKHTEKTKLLISAELAYLLYKQRGDVESNSTPQYRVEDNLRIVSYEKLKGIWNGRRYPIVWFHDTWDTNVYDYEEQYESEKVRRLINNDYYHIDTISKVFSDVNRNNEIDEYLLLIKDYETSGEEKDIETAAFNYIPREKLAEVHCAAICFDVDGRLLIAKRPNHKSRLKGKWEFGCGQLKVNQTFKECLIDSYRTDFSAELDLLLEDPIPVATYTVAGEMERKIPGLLFLAVVKNPDYVESNYLATKHDEVRWINIDHLESLDEKDCVPDFKSSASKAYELFQTHYKAQ